MTEKGYIGACNSYPTPRWSIRRQRPAKRAAHQLLVAVNRGWHAPCCLQGGMSKKKDGPFVTMMVGALLTGALTSSGEAADVRARALLSTQSPTSAEMSARTVSIPLDEYGLTSALPSVHFDFDSATIRAADRRVLDANAEWLKANRGQPVALGGAADPRGGKDYNLTLGQRRARAVKNYLIARGVSPDRITVLSTGEIQEACRDRECWGLDRRVDFLVRRLPRQAP